MLLLATNRLDLEADHVALGYRCRWSVERASRHPQTTIFDDTWRLAGDSGK